MVLSVFSPSHPCSHTPGVQPDGPLQCLHLLAPAQRAAHRLPRGHQPQDQDRPRQGDQPGPGHHAGVRTWTHGEAFSLLGTEAERAVEQHFALSPLQFPKMQFKNWIWSDEIRDWEFRVLSVLPGIRQTREPTAAGFSSTDQGWIKVAFSFKNKS